jgi:hypothetical protein
MQRNGREPRSASERAEECLQKAQLNHCFNIGQVGDGLGGGNDVAVNDISVIAFRLRAP